MNYIIANTLIEHHGDGEIRVTSVDDLVNYETSCGTVGDKHITPEFVDWLKELNITSVYLLIFDGMIQAMGIEYELTEDDEDKLYDEDSFFQQYSQGYSLNPSAFEGMTIFESE